MVGRAALALNACTAADIVGQEGANCPNNTNGCTITKTYVVGNNCVLDFGTRAVTVSGTLDVNSGALTFKAGSLTITSTGFIDGRGNGTPPATDSGGQISVETTGDVSLQRLNANHGRIDVSGNTQAGTIEIDAGGGITVAGRLAAAQLPGSSAGSGGTITLRAATDIVSLAGSVISSTGGTDGIGGGDMDFGATGKIDLGDALDVSGSDAGTVTLTAGDLINVQQISANGTGDGGAGGIVTMTAATSVQIRGNVNVQGAASSDPTGGAGDGGTASIEADYGDVLLAATIDASGYQPDGFGGEIDLFAQGAITLQSGTLNARADGSQGSGGLIMMQSVLSFTSSATVDASGGSGGGEVDLDAGSAITLSGTIDVSGRAPGSGGGVLDATAGEGGIGTFTCSGTIDLTGGGCLQGGACGVGGQAALAGCDVTVASTAKIKAGAPTAGEIDITASEQLMITGKVNAAQTINMGTDGRTVLSYPTRKAPVIAPNVVTPAPMLVGEATCTPDNQVNCLMPCPMCGNGVTEFPETCDDGAVGSTKSCDGCSPFCQIEDCDDGAVCTIDSCDNRLGCRNVAAPSPCIEPPTPTPTVTPTGATPTPTPSNTEPPTTTPAPKLRTTGTVPPTTTATPSATATPTSMSIATPTLSTTPTPSPTPTAIDGLPGDGNCDGGLTAADLTAIVKMMGLVVPGECPLADLNQDGVVDQTDLATTIQFEFIDSGP